ncbi:MAG: cysteine synthase family protein [Lentisphaeria bacterium]|nr:cysteine synthase family protein [Lentisphaeria bacterium]
MIEDFSALMKRTCPVVRLAGMQTEPSLIYAGLACLNPSGSIKDVMAWYMLSEAEKRGELRPGDTILEITTGNTGIAFSMLAAARGYRFTAVMPAHMSIERRQMMRAFGAEVILTPAEEDMPGALRRYEELRRELAPRVWLPNQFANEDNIRAHYQYTGTSLARQVPEALDFFVAGMGTGGTFLGVARRLRESHPTCRMVGIEPAESSVLNGGKAGPHGIQGIGEGFIPEIIARSRDELDDVAVIGTAEAEDCARLLAARCGILAGVSAGANVGVALRLAREKPGCRVLTLIPDRGERYLHQGLFGCSATDCVTCPRN